MKSVKTVLLAVVMSSCASSNEAMIESPAVVTQPKPVESSAGAAIAYHNYEGEARAYLPLTSAACQADDQAQVLYQPRAIWRFDGETGEWTGLEVSHQSQMRLTCEAMVAIDDVIGFDLRVGTYAVLAKVDGAVERGVFYVGESMCNDISIGEPQPGQVALCVLGPTSAEARMVPDPVALTP